MNRTTAYNSGAALARRLSFYSLIAGSIALYLADPFIRITDKNFLPSDAIFLLSAILLMFSYHNGVRFELEMTSYPGLKPFLVFLAAAMFGFLLTALRRPVSPTFHLSSIVQLLFTFLLLCPLVLFHKDSIEKARRLWSVHLWLIPFAGLLSVTDLLDLTAFGKEVGERHYNAILDSNFVNGFWLFALASPFLLQKMFPFRLGTLLYGALWTLGCAGTMLAGTRAAVGVAALSIVFVAWLNRKDIFQSSGFFASFVFFLLVTIGGGFRMLNEFPVVLGRFQQTQDFLETGQDDNSVSLRQDQLQIIIHDLRSPLTWLGSGLKQYRLIHPEDEIESVHNMYLQQIYDSGLVGFVAFFSIFGRCIQKAWQCHSLAWKRGDKAVSQHWACCVFAIAAYLVMGFVYPVGYYRHFWLPLFLATPSLVEVRNLNRAPAAS